LCSKSTDNSRVVHISSNDIFVYLTWNIRRATNGPISTHVLPSCEIVFLGTEGSILEYIGDIDVLGLKQVARSCFIKKIADTYDIIVIHLDECDNIRIAIVFKCFFVPSVKKDYDSNQFTFGARKQAG
jgi:hypothetical protein